MTQYAYFKGIAKWAKVHEPDPKFKRYTLDLYLDDEELEKYKATGIQAHIRTSEDGSFVKLARPQFKIVKDKMKEMGPPKVLDDKAIAITDNVGNGSEVYVQVSYYPTVKGIGHTLETVQVLSLVPFTGETSSEFKPYGE